MQRSLSRASTVSVTGTVLGILGLLLATAVPVAVASSWTCDYFPSTDRVRVVITGSGQTSVLENGGQIWVNSTWCDNVATITNTDRISILAGAGDQELNINWNGQGFRPGVTNEAGDSDEIEFSISLGPGTDELYISLPSIPDTVRAGKSSGAYVAGRVNLNAAETTGVDADITLVVGIEGVSINGSGGNDILSGAGGAGTGDAFTIPLTLYGHIGNDTVTGGTASDTLEGADGNDILTGGASGDDINGGPGSDTLKGGSGPDVLYAVDGVLGNDEVYGGTGVDTCLADRGDLKTSC